MTGVVIVVRLYNRRCDKNPYVDTSVQVLLIIHDKYILFIKIAMDIAFKIFALKSMKCVRRVCVRRGC